jgi:hypothetical protein
MLIIVRTQNQHNKSYLFAKPVEIKADHSANSKKRPRELGTHQHSNFIPRKDALILHNYARKRSCCRIQVMLLSAMDVCVRASIYVALTIRLLSYDPPIKGVSKPDLSSDQSQ